MKKVFLVLSLLAALVWIAAPVLAVQDEIPKKSDAAALKIVEKMIEAQGGRKLLESIKDTTVTGTVEMVQFGVDGAVSIYNKEPNMMRLDIEVMGMVITQAFDGESAWMFNPQTGANEEMPEQMADEFKREAMGSAYLLNPEKHNIVYVLKDPETLEGKEYLVLDQVHPDGWTATLWIDAETFLSYKVKAMGLNQMGVEVETETFTTDYKKVEGMMTAHTMTTYQDGEEFMTMTLTEIKLNTGIEDSFFKMDG